MFCSFSVHWRYPYRHLPDSFGPKIVDYFGEIELELAYGATRLMSDYLLIVVTAQFSLLLLMAMIFAMFFRHSLAGRLGVAYIAANLLFMLCELDVPDRNFTVASFYNVVIFFGCASVVWFRWVFLLSVLQDNFKIRAPYFLPLAAMLVTYFASALFAYNDNLVAARISDLAWYGLILALDGHVLYAAFFALPNDLVEFRRQFRIGFVMPLVSLVTVFNLLEIVALISSDGSFVAKNLEFTMTVTLVLAIWLATWIVAPRTADLFGGRRPGGEALEAQSVQMHASLPEPGMAPEDQTSSAAVTVDPVRDAILADLIRQMEGEEVFREHGLTLDELATRMAVQPYVLRRLINQGLGFRNFASYLNQFRVRAACDELERPELRQKQIISVALDSGYQSLGPFNRAFREVTGLTPSEYRRKSNAPAMV